VLQQLLHQQARTTGSNVQKELSCYPTSLSLAAAAAERLAPLSGMFWALLLLLCC
jgi:hypothetical protein